MVFQELVSGASKAVIFVIPMGYKFLFVLLKEVAANGFILRRLEEDGLEQGVLVCESPVSALGYVADWIGAPVQIVGSGAYAGFCFESESFVSGGSV